MHAQITRLDRRAAFGVAFTAAVLLVLAAGCSDSSEQAHPKTGMTPVDLATAGRIKVQVGYSGNIPAPRPLSMSGAPGCAKVHPEPVFEQPIVIQGGGLESAVVYIKSGLGDRGFPTAAEPVVIDQKGCLYAPRISAAMVGQPVKFVNSDPEPHNVRGRPQTVSAWNFMIGVQNASRTIQLNKPEVGIRVGCDIHPWMVAFLSVFDHPYFGVTKPDGTVTLENVPPGDYVIGAWHEKLGTIEKSVTLPARGAIDVDLKYGEGGSAG